MVEYPDVARYTAIPCALFIASALVAIVWGIAMKIQQRSEESLDRQEKERKAAALKART